jgi:uracil-DNA glycosylase family 4
MNLPGYPDSSDLQPALMTPEGTGSSGVCAMGEALGREEAKPIGLAEGRRLGLSPDTRLPFRRHAEAGAVLERAIHLIPGLDRQQLLITNAVWYQPPNNWLENAPWEHEAIAFCRPMNEKLYRERQPKCFLAMGGVAMRELTGMTGYRQGILLTRGFPVKSKYGIPCVGTYHPVYLRRGEKGMEEETGGHTKGAAGQGMDLLGVLIQDIKMALFIARSGWRYEPDSDVEYREHASVNDLHSFLNDAFYHPDLPISWDIETNESLRTDDESETVVETHTEIHQIQFSLRPKQAVICNWQDSKAFGKLVKEILALPNPKLDFNGRLTDRPITIRFMRDKGFEVNINGPCHDLMDMWHHAQPDLPKGLQHVASFYCPQIGPWKHLDTARPHWYGGRDVDAPQRIFAKLPGDLQKLHTPHSLTLWEGYHRHIFQLSPVLDRMSARGIPINDTKRAEFGKWLDEEKVKLEAKIQDLVPNEVKGIHPKEGYKRIPQALREALVLRKLQEGIDPDSPDYLSIRVGDKLYMQHQFNEVDQLKLIDIPTYRWVEKLPFNPQSADQVIRYIRFKREEEINAYVARGHQRDKAEERAKYKVPRNRKEQRDTTDKKELLALGKRTGDPLFGATVQVREFGKLKGTYVDGWKPEADGRAHPSFVFSPATSQLGSENPNAQNVVSEHSRGTAVSETLIALATKFRQIIEAPSGYTLIEFDYRSFHALTLGFSAQDPSYIRMARIDIHSYFAAVGLLRIATSDKLMAMPDDELAAYLAWVKEEYNAIRNGQAKSAILGYGNGLREQRLWEQNPEFFANKREARTVLDKLDQTFPIVAAFHKQTMVEAADKKFLLSQHGNIRRFWEVFVNKPVADSYQPRPGEKLFQTGDGQRWKVGHGPDAEAAVSFPVQTPGHGHLKDQMLEIDRLGWAEKYGMINTVHDALWFCCPESLAEECYMNVKPQMELPSKVLINPVAPEGLWCAVDATIGRDMQKREKFICQTKTTR